MNKLAVSSNRQQKNDITPKLTSKTSHAHEKNTAAPYRLRSLSANRRKKTAPTDTTIFVSSISNIILPISFHSLRFNLPGRHLYSREQRAK